MILIVIQNNNLIYNKLLYGRTLSLYKYNLNLILLVRLKYNLNLILLVKLKKMKIILFNIINN